MADPALSGVFTSLPGQFPIGGVDHVRLFLVDRYFKRNYYCPVLPPLQSSSFPGKPQVGKALAKSLEI